MRNWLIAIGIALLAIAAGGYWWYSSQHTQIVSEPIDAIPTSAVLVINYPDLNAAMAKFEEQPYAESLLSIAELQRYFSRNMLLDSIFRTEKNLKESLAGSTVWSSYHVAASDSLLVFHAIKPNVDTDKQLLNVFSTAIANAGILTATSFSDVPGFKLLVKEPFYELYGTIYNGLILLANDKNLISESIAQLNGKRTLRSDDTFSKLTEVAGKNVEANVYVNYRLAPEYIQQILKPTLTYNHEVIADFASWMELDLNLNPDGFVLNGFTSTADSASQFLHLFIDQKPRPIGFPAQLPANTASFIFYGISDLISFSADYREFLSNRGVLPRIETGLNAIQKKYGIDLEQNFLSWIGNAYGVCITEPKSTSFSDQTYWIFETRSEELAKKLLADLSANVANTNGTENSSQTVNGVEIGQIQLGDELKNILGEGYQDFANPFYMVYNNHAVFATTASSLERYLQYLQADRTLAKDLSFSQFMENLSSSYNVFTYHQLSRSKKIMESYLNRDAIHVLDANKDLMTSFEALGTQITSTGSTFYSNVYLRYNPNWQSAEETSWKCQLDAAAQIPPEFVTNHVSGEAEVIVQDVENKLYLFNSVGQELFKRELREPIESEIVQVDRYKNGNLQYVFNTKNFIYMIDRNGKDVDGFPTELKSQAETDLAVIEYDNKRDYRLLISCKNKRIYNYEIDGSQVKGWQHNKGGDPTIHQFRHMLVGGKDYIITGESDGKVHLLDRRGKNRVKVEKYIPPSEHNQLQEFYSSDPKWTGIYITNKDGLIHRVSLNGKVVDINVGKYSQEHHFLVGDLDGNKMPEFVLFDLNMLRVFGHDGEQRMEMRVEPGASAPKIITLADGRSGVAFHYPDSEQLILFDESGKPVAGFPISGNSIFDLTEVNGKLLICSAGVGNTVSIQTLE